MALSDAAVRQAKATGKDYTLGDIDGLSLAVTPRVGVRGTFATAGPANKNACRWGPTPKSAFVRRAPCGMKHERGWPRGSTLEFTANMRAMPFCRQIKTPSKACLTVGLRTGR